VRVSRFYRRSVLLAAVVAVAVVLALGAVHAQRGLDLSSIDWRFGIRGSEGPPSEVVVVGIDAATFSYLDAHHPGEAQFPFARRLDPRVISNLARVGAWVIAHDVQFTTAERGWSTKGPPHRGAGKAKPSPSGGRGNNKDEL